MTKHFTEAVVVGGGFAGLAAAAALLAAGVESTILETFDAPITAFRGELIHPPGVRMLAALGLEAPLVQGGAVRIQGFAAFESAEAPAILLPYASGPGMGVDHPGMVATFRQELSRRGGVQFVARSSVEDVLFERGRVVGVRCGNGAEYRARIVVAADGRHSKMRKRFGIPTESTLLSYMVAVGLETDPLPEAGRGHVFVGAPGPILAYPYANDRVRMCIDVPLGIPSGREGIARYVSEYYAPFLPQRLRDAMVNALGAGSFQVCANHAAYTEGCAVSGAALVGDAGGCSHPLAATGMTCALHDVTTLGESLKAHGANDDALLAYQKRRYRFIRGREVFAHALCEVLRGAGTGPQALRDGIFRYWRSSDRARRASMDILSGDASNAAAFVAEYTKVVALASWNVWTAHARGRDLRSIAEPFAGLLTTAGECATIAWQKSLSTLMLERTKKLPSASALPRSSARRTKIARPGAPENIGAQS